MQYKVNRTVNGLSVLIDGKAHLAPLADFLDNSPFRPVELRYHLGTDTGIILIQHDGIYDPSYIEQLNNRIEQYRKEKGI